MEKQTAVYRNRSLPWYQKKQRTVRFSLHNDEQEKSKTIPNKVRSSDQYYLIGKRKNLKPTSSSSKTNKKLLSSNMLTVAIT